MLSSLTSSHINKSQTIQSRNSNNLPPIVFRNFLSESIIHVSTTDDKRIRTEIDSVDETVSFYCFDKLYLSLSV
ncbi:unnamed protein product [Heterotrigona itama]|uniref:Uncharacterized protein n=1 Tax=Heterotrigona itama TaxID=395501 RepID=A0A6V7HKR0_9HYME|nr:unnamed protein product [Heterotrigona itama]